MKNNTESIKPIKRNPAIVDFSKDHHFTLLQVWKIREGLKKLVQVERISKFVLHFFNADLIPHFKAEEELLFTKFTTDNPLRIQAESEHLIIYKLIDELKNNLSDKELLLNIAGTLEKHIRFEERQLFNFLQENLSEAELTKIATELKTRGHSTDAAWNDVFWN
jgi:hypothetical protein